MVCDTIFRTSEVLHCMQVAKSQVDSRGQMKKGNKCLHIRCGLHGKSATWHRYQREHRTGQPILLYMSSLRALDCMERSCVQVQLISSNIIKGGQTMGVDHVKLEGYA
jgi:hypothetical protein